MKIVPTILTALAFIFPSCTSTSSQLDKMEQVRFDELLKNVDDTSLISGRILKDKLSPSTLAIVDGISSQIIAAFDAGSLSLPVSLSTLVDRYAAELLAKGVDAQEIDLAKATIRLVDNAFGNVKIGIDGALSPRARQVIVAIAKGIKLGLQ